MSQGYDYRQFIDMQVERIAAHINTVPRRSVQTFKQINAQPYAHYLSQGYDYRQFIDMQVERIAAHIYTVPRSV